MTTSRAKAFSDEIHTNVWQGPAPASNLGICKYKYYPRLRLLCNKDEALQAR